MAGYLGSRPVVVQVDGYQRTEAESRYVNVSGDDFTGHLDFTDDAKARFGSSDEMHIYTESSGSGYSYIQGDSIVLRKADQSTNYLTALGGVVSLMHSGNTKLATASGGINVTGTVTSTGNITAGSSTAGVVTVGSANGFEMQKSGVNGYINQSDSGPIIIRMGSGYSEKLRLDASGNLGLGVNPTHKLHVNGTVKVTGLQTFDVDSGGGSYIAVSHQGNESWTWDARSGSGSDDYLDVGISGGTRAMSWHETGKVGIGTTSPAALLHVNGSGDAVRVTSTNTGSGGAQVDLLHFTSSPADNDIHALINMGGYYSGGNSAYGSSIRSVWSNAGSRQSQLEFFTRDDSDFSARMVINKDGNVGIAKSSLATWSSGYNALQVGGRGFVGAHTGSDLYLGQNASFNSGWKYEASVAASMTQHSGGKITHFVAPAGTAGNAISWNTAMDITAEGTTTLTGTYSTTNSVNNVLRLNSSSSGTAVAGHGTGIQLLGERNDGNVQS